MKTIRMSVKRLYNLEPISYVHSTVSRISISGEAHIIKRIEGGSDYIDNTIYTVSELNNNRDILPKEFCIPDYFVETEDGIEAFTVPEVLNSLCLRTILKSDEFSHKEKIEYLKKFGLLLRECDKLRKIRSMRNFAIGDVQEENILVIPDKKDIRIVDMDTCRIGSGLSTQALYLTPYSLVMNVPSKYRSGGHFGYIATNRNSDLFCYVIMILNYIADKNIANINLEDYYSYLDYLDYLGFDSSLLRIFYGIVNHGENENPDYLLDTIDEKKLSKSRYNW